jgi:hypothetical protein
VQSFDLSRLLAKSHHPVAESGLLAYGIKRETNIEKIIWD